MSTVLRTSDSHASECRRFLPSKLRIKLLAVDRFFCILVVYRGVVLNVVECCLSVAPSVLPFLLLSFLFYGCAPFSNNFMCSDVLVKILRFEGSLDHFIYSGSKAFGHWSIYHKRLLRVVCVDFEIFKLHSHEKVSVVVIILAKFPVNLNIEVARYLLQIYIW